MSDRQLNTLNWHRLRLDPAVNISQGFTWDFQYLNSLGGSGDDTLLMVTGPKPVAIWSFGLSTDGARGALFELYIGGTVAGGQPVVGFPINHDQAQASPFETIEDSSFVSVGGVKIGELLLDGNVYSTTFGITEHVPYVFGANESHHLTVTNLHNQAADITVNILAGAIEQRPQGM